jgi:hypothetical protein
MEHDRGRWKTPIYEKIEQIEYATPAPLPYRGRFANNGIGNRVWATSAQFENNLTDI